MAMTLRLPDEIEHELRGAADDERRSVHATVLIAIEDYLAARETEEIKADPDALRSLADAREAVSQGDVVYGVDAARDLLDNRNAS